MGFLDQLPPEVKAHVKALSILRPMDELKPERIQGIIDAACVKLVEVALQDLNGAAIALRDLRANDFPGYTNDLYAETAATAIGYSTTTGGDNTAIADETFIALWGVKMMTPSSSETSATTYQAVQPPVSGFRISIGNKVVAIWAVYQIVRQQGPDLTDAATPFYPIAGITEHPIIIRQRQVLKIEEYTAVAAASGDPYVPVFLGATVERVGVSISAPS